MWKAIGIAKGTAGEYIIWQYTDESGKAVFQATKGKEPPVTAAGYYLLASLLRLKGLDAGNYRRLS